MLGDVLKYSLRIICFKMVGYTFQVLSSILGLTSIYIYFFFFFFPFFPLFHIFFLFSPFLHAMLTNSLFSLCVCVCVCV